MQRRIADDATADSLQVGLAEVDRLGADLGVGSQTETVAKTIYRRAVDGRLLYGRSCESIAAAAVYLGGRVTSVPRGLTAVASESPESRRRIARGARHLQRTLEIAVEPPAPFEYLPRIRSALDLDVRIERPARRLLAAAVQANLHSGRDPSGLAAGALYTVASAGEITAPPQTAVAEAAGVCPETIRRRHRELRPIYSEVTDTEPPASQPCPTDGSASDYGGRSTAD